MKLLFENWREYLSEISYLKRGEYIPKATDFDLPDVGDMYSMITVDNIINEPDKDKVRKLALLDIFNRLDDEMKKTDKSEIKHILASMRKMSGNSPEFDFQSGDKALEFYQTPHPLKDHPKVVISLKNWHDRLKVYGRVGKYQDETTRSEKFKSFRPPPSDVDPHADTSKKVAPTIKAKARGRSTPTIKATESVEEQTEPYQRAVKQRHKKMKFKLIGKGDNTYNVTGKMKKPSYKRSKSAPAGAGGS